MRDLVALLEELEQSRERDAVLRAVRARIVELDAGARPPTAWCPLGQPGTEIVEELEESLRISSALQRRLRVIRPSVAPG